MIIENVLYLINYIIVSILIACVIILNESDISGCILNKWFHLADLLSYRICR